MKSMVRPFGLAGFFRVFAGFILCFIVVSKIAIHLEFSLAPFPAQYTPENALWHLLQRHTIEGCVYGAGLCACLIWIVWNWKRFPEMSFMAGWQAVLFLGHQPFRALVIWIRCGSPFDATHRSAPWPNYEAYFKDPIPQFGWFLLFAVTMLLVFLPLRPPGCRTTRQDPEATKGDSFDAGR